MSVEVLYLLRKDEPAVGVRELDDVVLLADVTSDDGDVIGAGTEGTVVSVWPDKDMLEVEFAEPEGALASVAAANVRHIGRSAP